MKTYTDTDFIDKKPPLIFIKSTIQNYYGFCDSIKKAIEPDSEFLLQKYHRCIKNKSVN
jgi:hypothetical protein